MSASPKTIDQNKVGAIAFKILNDMGGAFTTALAHIGDRLGIFATMNGAGPLTSQELADKSGLNERYIREWLNAMTTAEYIDYDPTTQKFSLSAEQSEVLSNENSPFFVGGGLQMAAPIIYRTPEIMQAFQNGGGVSYAAFGSDVMTGIERFFRPGYVNFLTNYWLPSVPGLIDRLNAGINVADVGCGAGQALIQMAKAYPNSKFTGIDNDQASIDKATENAKEAGLADRVKFIRQSADALPSDQKYDLICTFDCIHDMANPRGALKAIRNALADGGLYLWTEPNCSDKLEENIGTVGRLFHNISPLHCMTVSLAHAGEGLGTVMGATKARELATEAGFGEFTRLEIDNPFNQFFVLKR